MHSKGQIQQFFYALKGAIQQFFNALNGDAQGFLLAIALLSIGIWFLGGGWGGGGGRTGGPSGSCTIIYRYMVPWLGVGVGCTGVPAGSCTIIYRYMVPWLGVGVGCTGVPAGSCTIIYRYMVPWLGGGGGAQGVLLALALLSIGIWFLGWGGGAQGVLLALALLSTTGKWFWFLTSVYQGFPTRMVSLHYISCLRYTILSQESSMSICSMTAGYHWQWNEFSFLFFFLHCPRLLYPSSMLKSMIGTSATMPATLQ